MAKLTRAQARLRRHQRVRKTISGSPEKPRLSVYRSLAEIYAQVIDDEAGHTLAAASTVDQDLREKAKSLSKTEQAKLVGKAVAERAKKAGIETVVFDRGGFRYIGRVQALADAAREAGLKF
jgi:large subunit ribosomal protein L18